MNLENKQPTNEDEAEMILIMMAIAKAKQIQKPFLISLDNAFNGTDDDGDEPQD
jgi:hypothetical protein